MTATLNYTHDLMVKYIKYYLILISGELYICGCGGSDYVSGDRLRYYDIASILWTYLFI